VSRPEAIEVLFVYGTLRRGQALHAHVEGLEPLGTGTIAGRLLDLGPYPGVLADVDGGRVRGELYRVSAPRLAELDEVEGFHPEAPGTSLFVREARDVQRAEGGRVRAWVYLLPHAPEGAREVPGGDWVRDAAAPSKASTGERSLGARMSGVPLIGVTTYAPREGLERFHLPTGYVHAVRRAGALPWLIAPGEERLEELVGHLDGLLLTGGGDLDPELYGGARHATLYSISRERDVMELALARLALERRLPTLGICRGCQVINVAFGGSLIEHLPDEVGETLAHRGDGPGTITLHPVELARGSRLAGIVGAPTATGSSSHHQAIRRLAEGFQVTARAADGTIEAVERGDHPFYLAVQWHPEDTAGTDPAQQRLFEALAVAARLHRGRKGAS